MLNPYFSNGTKSEQSLVQSLINEQLRMYGVEVYYMPRKYLTTNTVIKEVIQSEFDNAYPLEAYVDNYDGYGGQGTILSKFGIEDKDDLTLIISRERFETYITPLIKDMANVELSTRPKEGDLIYFPLGDRIFEVKFVEHEQPFYQLQKNYVYQLRCELFRYEDEVLDTNVDEIDELIDQTGYIQTLSLFGPGIGSTATATAHLCASGSVQEVFITNMGKNYTSPPQVAFSSAPAGGVTATGIASVNYDYPGCWGKTGRVEAVLITNAGCGYSQAPWVSFSGGGGSGAAATTGICTTGSVQYITIDSGGSGYIEAPSVNIGGTGGDYETFSSEIEFFDDTREFFDNDQTLNTNHDKATGVSTINSAGVVTAIYLTNAGCGYTSVPEIIIGPPPITGTGQTDVGVGNFCFNEVITGQTSGTTARVKEWTASGPTLEISIVDGSFSHGEIIVGEESGARYMVSGLDEYDRVDGFADNDNIEYEADQVIDFSVTNPFGMP